LAEEQRNRAQVNQSLLLSRSAQTQLRAGRPVEAALLALEGLPDPGANDPLYRTRPLVDQAQIILRQARRAIHEEAVLADLGDGSAEIVINDAKGLAVLSPAKARRVMVVDLAEKSTRYVLPVESFRQGFVFSGDGNFLATFTKKGELVVYETGQGTEVSRSSISFTANRLLAYDHGRQAVFMTSNQGAAVLDLESGRHNMFGAETAAVSPDFSRLAVINKGVLELRDMGTGELLGQSSQRLTGPVNDANRLVFSPDGLWLAVASDLYTWVFRGDTAAFVGNTGKRKKSQLAIGFSPDSRWLYIGGADGQIIIYNPSEKKIVVRYEGHKDWVFDADIAEKSDGVLTTGSNGEVHYWDPVKGQVLLKAHGHLGIVTKGRLLEKQNAFLTASADGTVRYWRLPQASTSREKLVDEFREEPVYSHTGRMVALSGAGLFHVFTGDAVVRAPSSRLGPSYIAFSSDDNLVLGLQRNSDNLTHKNICLYESKTGQAARCFIKTTNVWSASMNAAASIVAGHIVINQESLMISFDGKTGEELGRFNIAAKAFAPGDVANFSKPIVSTNGDAIYVNHVGREILALAPDLSRELRPRIKHGRQGALEPLFIPQDDKVVFYWANGDFEVYALSTGKLVTQFNIERQSNADISVSPSGKYMVVPKDRGKLLLVDSQRGDVVLEMAHPGVESIQAPIFDHREDYVMASRDGATMIWDIKSKRKIETVKMDFGSAYPFVYVKGFSADRSEIVTWSWTDIRRWAFHPDPLALIAATQKQAPRCLSQKQRELFSLPPAPPRWCITGAVSAKDNPSPENWKPKWPYAGAEWRAWQLAKDKGEPTAMPK